MRRAWAVGLVLVLLVACGGDDDDLTTQSAVAGPTTHPDPGDDPSKPETTDGWCDTFRRLTTGPEPTTDEVSAAADSAPEAINDAMSTITSDDLPISAAQLLEAIADVEAWAHQNCGTAHPFCGAWIQYKGLVAGIALSGASEDEQAQAQAEAEDVLEVAGRYAPGDLARHLDTIASTSVLSDEQEREAEAAHDEVDAWIDSNC